MANAPRIALCGIDLESNAFSPPATEADFHKLCYLEGEAIVADARSTAPRCIADVTGFVTTMDVTGPWKPVPLVYTHSHPWGPADQGFFDRTADQIAAGLQGVDAIFVEAKNCSDDTVDLVHPTLGAVQHILLLCQLHHPLLIATLESLLFRLFLHYFRDSIIAASDIVVCIQLLIPDIVQKMLQRNHGVVGSDLDVALVMRLEEVGGIPELLLQNLILLCHLFFKHIDFVLLLGELSELVT